MQINYTKIFDCTAKKKKKKNVVPRLVYNIEPRSKDQMEINLRVGLKESTGIKYHVIWSDRP